MSSLNNNTNLIDIVYKMDDGIIITDTYDSRDRSRPLKVEVTYPRGYKHPKEQAKHHKTKQRYLNPKTNKTVSYARAKQLGLI